MTQRRVLNGSADQTTTYGYLASEQEIPNLNTESSTNLICRMTQPCISYVYGYAGNTDNLTSEKREGGSYAGTVTYEYDSLGQLTRVNDPTDPRGGAGTTWVYSYDRGGNILSKKRYAYTTGALGTPQLTIPYSYTNANWKDQLTALNGAAFEYDAIGNPTSDGTQTYEWTDGRKLAHTNNEATGMDVTYEYDHNGMRIRKSAGQHITNYTLRGDKIAYLTWGIYPNDKMRFEYDGQGRPAIVNFNGADYHYLYNLQGDVVGLIDSTGTLVVEYNYDAWGRIIGRTGSLVGTLGWLNPFRYRGYVYDEETGLYYLRSRYYNPEWGRFINADALLGKRGALLGHNLFAYCKNHTVTRKDCSGYEDKSVISNVPIIGRFMSIDGAAAAFAAETYAATNYIRHEYGTKIYAITSFGFTTYDYVKPKVGQPHGIIISDIEIPEGTKLVATAHTHPISNKFSGTDEDDTEGDIPMAKARGVDSYVVGPDRVLQRYSVVQDEIIPLGTITPIELTSSQKERLVDKYRKSWDVHPQYMKQDCGCKLLYNWPTE